MKVILETPHQLYGRSAAAPHNGILGSVPTLPLKGLLPENLSKGPDAGNAPDTNAVVLIAGDFAGLAHNI
jgi:hypothetical protein